MKNIFAKLFAKAEPSDLTLTMYDYEAERDAKIEAAYLALTEVMAKKKATKADLTAAIEEAIGYLGEVRDE